MKKAKRRFWVYNEKRRYREPYWVSLKNKERIKAIRQGGYMGRIAGSMFFTDQVSNTFNDMIDWVPSTLNPNILVRREN